MRYFCKYCVRGGDKECVFRPYNIKLKGYKAFMLLIYTKLKLTNLFVTQLRENVSSHR